MPWHSDNLGEMYYYGLGVTQDYKKARHYYELAAAQGDAWAQNHLGSIACMELV